MKNAVESKAEAVREMFSAIAHRYDLLNHLLSFGIDIQWRKKTVECFGGFHGGEFLDLACGTGDLSIAMANGGDGSAKVTGGDFSENMIKIGREKVKSLGLDGRVNLEFADALDLSYQDCRFDGVTCAFGVRNFADLDRGLAQMVRVIKHGGRIAILEFTTPDNRLFAAIYRFYFTRVLPFIGGILSGRKSAYEYLPDSVYKFPAPGELLKKLEALGIAEGKFIPLTFGICGIYTGVKK
ncbi:MAG: bifunctional demethylmenaquinone methyltransferase/2-methoxy-6-polyprenyl-1,4-benzoquinol methylase UbiE [Nitrospinae bacterium]|nr:bifunctional demethylmenaquinone methyltransferase/2-methoxy-6-polyprenyl-1,4-benzoquinol methylase UbiE [Nitrospinota bacterium]